MFNNKTKVLWRIWGIGFLYICIVSAFIQFILLPFLLPRLHAGGGLFLGCPDCLGFNQAAANMAEKIKTMGWTVWELRPQGNAPVVGIVSIIYALTWSKLWVLIPLNAALHASAFLILFQLLNLFIKDKNRSFLSALPFLIFPSNLQWTSQIHKDGFSILGILLFLQSIVSLSRLENWRDRHWYLIVFRSFIFYSVGIFLIWIVRPFMLIIMQFIMVPLFILLIVTFLVWAFKGILSWKKTLFASVFFLIIFFISLQVNVKFRTDDLEGYLRFSRSVPSDQEISEPETQNSAEYTPTPIVGSPLKDTAPITVAKAESPQLPRSVPSDQKISKPETQIESYWIKSSWLPLFIESKVYSLARVRKGFRFSAPEAKSGIDQDVGFNSVKSVLIYLPRAAQIVLLAPFPNQWFVKGSSSGGFFMRRISAFEMIVVYFALIFLPYAIWYWRKRIEIWVIFVFCMYMMLIYGLVVCNVGTLYRMRYAYITTLAALGIAGFFAFLDKLIIRRKGSTG